MFAPAMSSSSLKIAWAAAAVSAAAAVGVWVYANDPVRQANVTLLRETSEEARRLDAENKKLSATMPKDEEVNALRRTNAEMLRIRTETLQARRDTAALNRSTNAQPAAAAPELADLSTENQRLRAEALALVNRAAAVPTEMAVTAAAPVRSSAADSGRIMLEMMRRLREQGADPEAIRATAGGLRKYVQENGTSPTSPADLSKYLPADVLEKLKGESFELVQKNADGTTYLSTNATGIVIRKESPKP